MCGCNRAQLVANFGLADTIDGLWDVALPIGVSLLGVEVFCSVFGVPTWHCRSMDIANCQRPCSPCWLPHTRGIGFGGRTLALAHVTEVMGEEAGWRVWDEAPSGTWQKTILPPKGEVFRKEHQPTYHPHRPLFEY